MEKRRGSLSASIDHEQQRFAPTVRPLHQQRHIELAEALAEPFLELLLAHRQHFGIGEHACRLLGREEGQGLVQIVQDQVFEVLVVVHGPILTDPSAPTVWRAPRSAEPCE